MKKIIVKAVAVAISMILIIVLTLCFTSCAGQEWIRIVPKEAKAEQQTFSLEMSVSQGVYSGERGILKVTSYGDKLLQLCLTNNNGESMTSFGYSNDTIIIGNGLSMLRVDINGLPRSFTSGIITGQIDYGFTIDGELKQIHITRDRSTEVFIEYTYGEEEFSHLRWASYYPDMTNTLSGCKNLGEMLATIGMSRSGKIVDKISVTRLIQDTKYLGEISVIREDSTCIKLESRSITTSSVYGTPDQWQDRNVDGDKWYRLIYK